jgi:hypothetical protein
VADSTIHAGAVAPYAFRYTVTSSDPSTFDLTAVTGGDFQVQRGSGARATWSAAIAGAPTATTLVLEHVFAAGDVPDPDCLKVWPRMSTPGGDIFAQAKTLQVVPLSER